MIVAQTNRLADPETLTTTTHIVRIPSNPEYGSDAYEMTFGVVWRPVNAKTGRIAGYAVSDEHTGNTESGLVFDTNQREKLARRLYASLGVWDDHLHDAIVECLNTVARTLLESAAA